MNDVSPNTMENVDGSLWLMILIARRNVFFSVVFRQRRFIRQCTVVIQNNNNNNINKRQGELDPYWQSVG